jgi:hypothetical protein
MSAGLFPLLGFIFAFVVAANFAMSHGEDWSPGLFRRRAYARRDDWRGIRPSGRGRIAVLTEGLGCPTGHEADGAKEVR